MHPTKEIFMTKRDGQTNFDALQNVELPPGVEASLKSKLIINKCPVYTSQEIAYQEQVQCTYTFMDVE